MRRMEEKSLKVYDTEKTFFSKITNTLNKILAPGKMGLNGMLISIKRNNVLKNYENYIQNEKNSDKKGMLLKKYEESYSLYLEAIDKNIIENIYKKVKNNTATDFEKNALSKYYMVIHIKDSDYTEYKYRKQKPAQILSFGIFTVLTMMLMEAYSTIWIFSLPVIACYIPYIAEKSEPQKETLKTLSNKKYLAYRLKQR